VDKGGKRKHELTSLPSGSGGGVEEGRPRGPFAQKAVLKGGPKEKKGRRRPILPGEEGGCNELFFPLGEKFHADREGVEKRTICDARRGGIRQNGEFRRLIGSWHEGRDERNGRRGSANRPGLAQGKTAVGR